MSITHTVENGRLKSRRRVYEDKPPTVDTAELRRQIRLNKDAGHSRLPTHHVTLEKLLDAYDAQNGVKEDWREMTGKDCGIDD